MKRSVTIGTAGHIDHGKTALVRALTGVDTDRLPQEKKRGITIDLGFAHLDVGDTRVGIVDVPGHERFIKNMLAGAAGIEGVMLIVAADDGVMPQTREHLAILDMLRVHTGIVVLTKTDLVKPDWHDLVEAEVAELVQGTVLEGAPIVRTSAATGVGIDELRIAIGALVSTIEREVRREPFRMPIDRCFVVEGRGTVVTGTIWSGSVSLDEELECWPSGKMVKVRDLQSHAQSAERLERGRRAAINLSGAHHSEIERGCELATPGYLKPSRRLTVELSALSDSPWPIKHRSRVRLHIGTAEVMASVRLLKGQALDPGQSSLAQLVCARPVATTCRQPLVVRAESPLITIGGGMVLQPAAPLIRPANTELIARVGKLASSDHSVRTMAAIYLSNDGQWSEHDLCRDADVGLDEVAGLIGELESSGSIIKMSSGQPMHVDRLNELGQRLEQWLGAYHEQQPLQVGAPMVVLNSQLDEIPDDVLGLLIERMIDAGRLKIHDSNVALASFEPALSGTQRDLLDRVSTMYREAGFKPPEISGAASALDVDERSLRPVMQLAVAGGQLVHLGSGLYMDAQAERTMRERIVDHLERSGEMAMSDLRDLLETSRKYAVPLGEYLDRAGVTRRKGDVRVLVRATKAQAT